MIDEPRRPPRPSGDRYTSLARAPAFPYSGFQKAHYRRWMGWLVSQFDGTFLRRHAGLLACVLMFGGSLAFSIVQAAWAPITYDEAYT